MPRLLLAGAGNKVSRDDRPSNRISVAFFKVSSFNSPERKRVLYWPKPEIRLGQFVFSALGIQLLVIYAGLGEAGTLRRFLFVVSYLLLFPFIWANRRRVGIVIIAAGLFLNFLAIVANAGLMPITPDAVSRAGLEENIAGVEIGGAIPVSKNVLLERHDTRLWPLTDILVWDNPTSVRAFSVGDLIIGAGLAVTLMDLLLPRLRRTASDEADGGSPG